MTADTVGKVCLSPTQVTLQTMGSKELILTLTFTPLDTFPYPAL